MLRVEVPGKDGLSELVNKTSIFQFQPPFGLFYSNYNSHLRIAACFLKMGPHF